jgi:DNA-binding NarL/FixJ family response regulator
MSAPVSETRVSPPDRPSDRLGSLALVVSGDALELLGSILEGSGLAFAHFGDLASLLETDDASEPELVLMWADDTGPALPRALESLKPIRTIVLCPEIKGWEVHCALGAGAQGIVLEQELERALLPCIEAVLAGQVCVPRSHWRQIEAPALSSREKQILGLVVLGYMNSQIAEQLFLAESTVKSHLSSAFAKLGVRSRHEAVSLIVDPERGLSLGILGLGGEQIELTSATHS